MLDFEHWKQVAPAEEVLERWKKLGMLEGLSEEQAKKCADYFEYMAIWILKNGEAVITDDKLYREPAITDDKLFGLVVFPAIKKIVRNDNGFSDALFNCRKIYDLYKEICCQLPPPEVGGLHPNITQRGQVPIPIR